MKFINVLKRHKGLTIVGGLSLVLLIVIFAIFSRMIFSTGKGEYGDRLKNIVDVPKSVTDKVKEEIKGKDEVKDITVRIQGKIIYTTIKYTDDTSKSTAKDIASSTLEYYDEDILKCYDFEFLLTQDEKLDEDGNDTSYNLAGGKHSDSDNISWARD